MHRAQLERTRDDAAALIGSISELLMEMDHDYIVTGTRRSGEVRRRSMDLTRSLANLRKP